MVLQFNPLTLTRIISKNPIRESNLNQFENPSSVRDASTRRVFGARALHVSGRLEQYESSDVTIQCCSPVPRHRRQHRRSETQRPL